MDDLVVGIHLQTRDRVAVIDSLNAIAADAGLVSAKDEGNSPRVATCRFLVAPPRGQWISVYPEPAEEERHLARGLVVDLAKRVRAAAILVGRVGEAAFFYLACDAEGRPGDEYHSCPEQELEPDQEEPDEDELARTRGDVGALGETLGGVQARERLAEVLAAARIDRLADCDPGAARPDVREGLTALARSLGLPDLYPDFDEVRHFLAPDEGLDVSLLAFRPPPKSRLEPVRALLSALKARRSRGKPAAEGKPAGGDDDEDRGEAG